MKPKKCILNKHRPNKVTLFGRWNEIINITYRVTMISGNVTQSRKAFYRSQAWKIIVAQVIVTFWLIVTLQNNWYTLKIGGDWDSWGKQTERNAISYSVLCKAVKLERERLPLRIFKMLINAAPPAGGGTVKSLYPLTPGRETSNGLTSVAL